MVDIEDLPRTIPEIAGLLFALSLVAAGCATTAPALTPIRDPTQRLDLPGVSVLPPKGANWFLTYVPPKPDVPLVSLVTFVKKPREEPPTRPADARVIYARVTAADLQDPGMQAPPAFETPAAFLDWLKQSAEKRVGEMVTGRQRLIEHDATLDDSLGATCARYRRVTELPGLGSFRESVFILATRGLFCLHPHWPRYLMDIGYTQLHLKGEGPLPLDAEVEPFLRSPVFTSTRPMAQAPMLERWGSYMRLSMVGAGSHYGIFGLTLRFNRSLSSDG